VQPPKSSNPKQGPLTIVKFKQMKTTLVFYLQPGELSLNYLKESAKSALRLTGGLDLYEKDPQTGKYDFLKRVDVVSDFDLDDLKLAIPKDKQDPYANNWIEIVDEDALLKITFKDFDIIAIGYKDNGFFAVEPDFEDDDDLPLD